MKDNIIYEMYFPDEELTWFGFKSHMESFMRQLLTDPITADVDDFLKSHNISKKKALTLLLKKQDPKDERSAVMICTCGIHPEELSEEDELAGKTPKDNYRVQYKLPRENYKKKLRRVYIENFEPNVINEGSIHNDYNSLQVFKNQNQLVDEIMGMDNDNAYKNRGGLRKVNEEGEGATNASSSGQFSTAINKPIKRTTIYITEDQLQYIKEATAGDIGNGGQTGIAYPLTVKNNDPTLNHKDMIKNSHVDEDIKIKEKNKGKFTATKERTGKSTEELTHSKNPLTRKRAIFAQNAKKWNHNG